MTKPTLASLREQRDDYWKERNNLLVERRELDETISKYELGLNYLADCCNGDCGLPAEACPGCYAREILRSK